MSMYNIVAATDESTVVAEYSPVYSRSDGYQSEAALEKELIRVLQSQGYEYFTIHDEFSLIRNLKKQLELLNQFTFSDNEWKQFFSHNIASANESIVEKTRKIQDDHIQILHRDDSSTKNIYLIDKKNIHNNRLQVINQYEEISGTHNTRYDVTILVNGLPLVHVELKRRGVAIREAFNQIKRYQRDSFWAASGLYEYVQMFVISNGTYTKYYSNTTRDSHIKEMGGGEQKRSKKTSNSFEFTSFWADATNKAIPDLIDFTKTFLSKHTLLNVLTKYCVFTSENLLLVMRPYQIAATEKILSRIQISTNYKKTGSLDSGGYIWHTTGSGKTFTLANVISQSQRPAILLAPNKTLAAQLYGEMKSFFPNNAVEYFVSYYDYYQPEAYVPTTDTFIEKDASVNAHIEQMRLSATKALLERKDAIIVASVSAIYGLGDPKSYLKMMLHLSRGEVMDQRDILRRLAELQYSRNDVAFERGQFRVRGEVIDIFPAESDQDAVRIEMFDDEVDCISIFDPLTGAIKQRDLPRFTVYPKTHYVTPREKILEAIEKIKDELRDRAQYLKDNKKYSQALSIYLEVLKGQKKLGNKTNYLMTYTKYNQVKALIKSPQKKN